MSKTVTRLISKRDTAAETNLTEFVTQARRTTAFGQEFDFDSNIWDVTRLMPQKSKRGRTTLVFGAWGQPRPSKNVQVSWISDSFLNFAKAYIVYQYELTRKISFIRELQALRVLDYILCNSGESSPTKLTSFVFDAAVGEIVKRHVPGAAHGIGGTLQNIAALVDELMISRAPIQWKSCLAVPVSPGRLGKDFERRRESKLPSSDILTALGNAYHTATDPEDVVYTSMCALMLSSPDRANEVVSLLVDCESSTLGDGSSGYALRWWPSKGALPQLKAIPAVMQDLVKDAIGRIKEITNAGREIAKWYEDQVSVDQPIPTKIFLPAHLEYLRDKELISRAEVAMILWGDEKIDIYNWCKNNKISVAKVDGRKYLHRFSDIESAVIAMLPQHFPYSDNTRRWKCSELLFTLPKFSNTLRIPFLCVYVPMDRVDLNYRLDGKNKTSIFFKNGCAEVVDGEVRHFKVASHAFRHYLNHLAHTNGSLSDLDINLWSGRTSRGETYNHVSSRELSERAALLVGDAASTLPIAKPQAIKVYVRSEFQRLNVETGHTTAFGYCVHDFSASPCEKHEDCLDCIEHFCIKGDSVRELNIRRERDELEHLVAKAETAYASGVYGADRWLERQRVRLKRAVDLISIIDNPAVPVGTPARLTGTESYSRIEHIRSIAAEDRQMSSSKPAAEKTQLQMGHFSLLSVAKS